MFVLVSAMTKAQWLVSYAYEMLARIPRWSEAEALDAALQAYERFGFHVMPATTSQSPTLGCEGAYVPSLVP